MKNLLLKLLTFTIVISTALFLGTACKPNPNLDNGENNNNNNNNNGVPPVETSQGLAFSESLNGLGFVVTGYGTCNDKRLIIPSTYENKPVIEINSSAFKNNEIIEEVVIPNSITTISENAFANCKNLAKITLNEGVLNIKGKAFINCNKLTDITIPNSVESIGDYAFKGCYNLTNATIKLLV